MQRRQEVPTVQRQMAYHTVVREAGTISEGYPTRCNNMIHPMGQGPDRTPERAYRGKIIKGLSTHLHIEKASTIRRFPARSFPLSPSV